MANPGEPTLLCGARLDGRPSTDVRLAGGLIVEVGAGLSARPGEQVHHLDGRLLLPAPAEPHAHLDKALLAERVPNPAGDLRGAVAAIRAAYPTIDARDVTDRADRALTVAAGNGYTAVRSHVDCDAGIATRALAAVTEVRRRWAGTVTVQVVALAGFPVTGRDGATHRRILAEAIDAGADVVGGVPALDPDPPGAVRELTRIAAEHDLPLDVHLDETTDPDVLTLRELATAVSRCGLGGRATASHCVSLGQQDRRTRLDVARTLADTGIAVVTLPQTNLHLQGRDASGPVPRGLTAVRELVDAGVTLAAGGDNWRDPFNPLGRIDPMETAALMVAAGHLDPGDAFRSVCGAARQVMGLPEVRIAPGHPAGLLAVRATSLREAIAAAPTERMVWSAGRLVSSTRTVHDIVPGPAVTGQT